MPNYNSRADDWSRYDREFRSNHTRTADPSIGMPTYEDPNGPLILFVDSVKGSDLNDGRRTETALATLAKALTFTTASHGDVIYVKPGHAETLTAAIAVSVAGVSIIGLGNGRLRPKFTNNPAATANAMAISGANVYVSGLFFASSSLTSTSHINVTAADVEIEGCEFSQGASDADSIILGAGSARAYVHDCYWRVSASGPARAISIGSATTSDGIRLERLRFHGGTSANTWSTACISSAVAHLDCVVNEVICDFGMIVSFTSATSTGVIVNAWPGQLGTAGNQIRIGGCELQGGPQGGYLLRIADAAIPQTSNLAMGTATGGRVSIIGLVGQVGTIIGAVPNAVKFIAHPAVGTDVDLCATVDINALEAGGFVTFSPTGLVATAAIKAAAGGFGGAVGAFSKVLASGAVLRFNTAGNSGTGTMKWDIYWLPLDPGASLV